MTDLTKKDVPFAIGAEAREAFRKLKEMFTTAPILTTFDPDNHLVIETDASGFAISGILSQPDDQGRLRPLAYYSRKMDPAERNYEIHDMELLAIVESFRQWEHYLEGSKFTIDVFSDHLNLTRWTSDKKLNKRQIRWAESLSPFKFRIHHVQGKENVRADAMSRRVDYMEGNEQQSFRLFKWEEDKLVLTHSQAIEETRANRVNEELSQETQRQIISMCHDDRVSGHKGIDKTLEIITRNWEWPGIRKDVTEYVGQCNLCAKTKTSRHKPYGKLQALRPPSGAWEEVTMDFIGPLPWSTDPATQVEYDMIYVIMDRLTKYAYFIPIVTTTNAEELAYVFMRHVFASHGMPSRLVSDRDKLFRSKFWQSLMDQLGSKNKLSTSFHPETDGQTERTNQTLEQYLRSYVSHEQDDWVTLLPLAQVSYNNSKVATGLSPFYANYGFHPNVHQHPLGIRPKAQQATIQVDKLKELHIYLSDELEFLADRMAKYANKRRSEGPDFKEGGKAYLLRKNIKTKRPSDKLDFKKLGPFKIEKKLGPVTYKLKLPKDMKIHPVFHVALLEEAPTNARIQESLPVEPHEDIDYDVEEILAAKLEKGKPVYLIKWLGYDKSENSWEPETNLAPDTLQEAKTKHPEWFPLKTPKRAKQRNA